MNPTGNGGLARISEPSWPFPYLTSRFPDEFLSLLCGKVVKPTYLSIEETDEGDRYDVLVKAGRSPIILEGKIGFRQNPRQLFRYVQSVRKKYGRRPGMTIIDVGSQIAQGLSAETHELRSRVKPLRFVTWSEVATVCRNIIRYRASFKRDRVSAAIAEDMVRHLEENQMISDERPEIYLRELSTSDSVKLYFRHNIYKSDPKFLRSAQNNLYFAPYFTQQTARKLRDTNLVPVAEGISYVSKIKDIQVVPIKDLLAFLKRCKDVEDPKGAAELIRKGYRARDIMLLILGRPRLAFPSAVTKARLSRVETHKKFTPGALGSRSCTLEELLAASHG